MKNTAINTLVYTGTVTLSQYINNKKYELARISNTGYSPLFEFFSYCLTGDFDSAKPLLPNKIMLLNITKDEKSNSLNYEGKSGFIYLMSAPKIVNLGVVRLSFGIPRAYIDGNTKFNGIGLYSDLVDSTDLDMFTACCTLEDNLMGIASGSSILIVDWELKISNSTENHA